MGLTIIALTVLTAPNGHAAYVAIMANAKLLHLPLVTCSIHPYTRVPSLPFNGFLAWCFVPHTTRAITIHGTARPAMLSAHGSLQTTPHSATACVGGWVAELHTQSRTGQCTKSIIIPPTHITLFSSNTMHPATELLRTPGDQAVRRLP